VKQNNRIRISWFFSTDFRRIKIRRRIGYRLGALISMHCTVVTFIDSLMCRPILTGARTRVFYRVIGTTQTSRRYSFRCLPLNGRVYSDQCAITLLLLLMMMMMTLIMYCGIIVLGRIGLLQMTVDTIRCNKDWDKNVRTRFMGKIKKNVYKRWNVTLF